MAAEIVALPVPQRSCFNCAHATFSSVTTYCPVFGEHIFSERAAASDCPSYEPE